ncbi:MAG: oxidoreductase [Acidobacteriaceae bacterium]|nr:oxidoreductase [Acidobacteriaceae bacterium]
MAEKLGGVFSFPGTGLTVNRVGFGAMQLTGPHIFGPPKDREECVRVVRRAVEEGVNHIDTGDFYGPHYANWILQEALHPYRDDLVIATKVGAYRGGQGEWVQDHSREVLEGSVHDNLRNLKRDVLQVVNVRGLGLAEADPNFDIRPSVEVIAELQHKGLVQHIGVSNVNAAQVAAAQSVAPIVCVQNMYNVAHRADDALIEDLSRQGIAYVPFFPLGGFSPLQSDKLNAIAASLEATPLLVAQAWLLQRSPNLLLISGTSKVAHLEENLKAGALYLPPAAVETLDSIAAQDGPTA